MGCCQKGCPHTYHYACAVDTGEPGHRVGVRVSPGTLLPGWLLRIAGAHLSPGGVHGTLPAGATMIPAPAALAGWPSSAEPFMQRLQLVWMVVGGHGGHCVPAAQGQLSCSMGTP